MAVLKRKAPAPEVRMSTSCKMDSRGWPWEVTISDTLSDTLLRWGRAVGLPRIEIGCQTHRIESWEQFDDREIAQMGGVEAVRFWRRNKALILGRARELFPEKKKVAPRKRAAPKRKRAT
jgi:hypothetical protein